MVGEMALLGQPRNDAPSASTLRDAVRRDRHPTTASIAADESSGYPISVHVGSTDFRAAMVSIAELRSLASIRLSVLTAGAASRATAPGSPVTSSTELLTRSFARPTSSLTRGSKRWRAMDRSHVSGTDRNVKVCCVPRSSWPPQMSVCSCRLAGCTRSSGNYRATRALLKPATKALASRTISCPITR